MPPKSRSGRELKRANPKIIRDRQRQRDAIELRKAGLTYSRIAEALGYASPQSARESVLAGLREMDAEGADAVALIQQQQLNTIGSLLWRRATRVEPLLQRDENNNVVNVLGPDGQPFVALAHDTLPFIDRFLAVQRQISALLGTDAPQRKEVEVSGTVHTGGTLIVGGGDERAFIESIRAAIEQAQLPVGEIEEAEVIE